ALIVMNRPSLDKFENDLAKGGLLILDSDLVDRMPIREDIEVICVPAQTEAMNIGSKQIANMVLLGTLVKRTGIVPMEGLVEALKAHGKEKFFEINKKALEVGASYVK
ncbi:MAG: 2-oxoglutarate ferredoxin oxidoreductase subunit gamma, partial [Clostridium sp.]